MKTHLQTDVWIYRLLVVLGFIVVMSVVITITMMILGWSLPEIILALGVVAVSGLIRLLISPLNRELFE